MIPEQALNWHSRFGPLNFCDIACSRTSCKICGKKFKSKMSDLVTTLGKSTFVLLFVTSGTGTAGGKGLKRCEFNLVLKSIKDESGKERSDRAKFRKDHTNIWWFELVNHAWKAAASESNQQPSLFKQFWNWPWRESLVLNIDTSPFSSESPAYAVVTTELSNLSHCYRIQ